MDSNNIINSPVYTQPLQYGALSYSELWTALESMHNYYYAADQNIAQSHLRIREHIDTIHKLQQENKGLTTQLENEKRKREMYESIIDAYKLSLKERLTGKLNKKNF